MESKITHYPVNWVDGMKVSKKHFLGSQDSLSDQMRDLKEQQLTSFNYGMIGFPDQSESLEILVNIDSNKNIGIRLQNCQAITPDGCRVDIQRSHGIELTTTLDQVVSKYNLLPSSEYVFYIVLSVDLFARVPVGTPDAEETPPRHPYTIPGYSLHIVPLTQINSRQFLGSNVPVGKILFDKGELKYIANYIPPSCKVSGHKLLLSWYSHFEGLISNLERNSISIIQKIKLKEQKNQLTESVHFIANRLLSLLSVEVISYRLVLAEMPPIHLCEALIKIIHNINTSIACLSLREKEEVLNYFGEWAEVTPANFEARITAAVNFSYNHLEIGAGIESLEETFKKLSDLFFMLSQLEFIGKRKGQNVFIVEHPVLPETPEKKSNRWSPLS